MKCESINLTNGILRVTADMEFVGCIFRNVKVIHAGPLSFCPFRRCVFIECQFDSDLVNGAKAIMLALFQSGEFNGIDWLPADSILH